MILYANVIFSCTSCFFKYRLDYEFFYKVLDLVYVKLKAYIFNAKILSFIPYLNADRDLYINQYAL